MEPIAGSGHRRIVFRLRGYPNPFHEGSIPDIVVPDSNSVRIARDSWEYAGEEAAWVAEDLQHLSDNLFDEGGWKGESADTFRKKVEQVIWFAKEIAHACDKENPKPDPPQDDDSPFETTSYSDNAKGFRQVMDDVRRFLSDMEADDYETALPLPPWWRENYWVKGYATPATGMTRNYEVRNDDGVVWGHYDHDVILDKYSAWNIQTRIESDGLYDFHLPDGPKETDKFCFGKKLNESQKETCQATATDLAETYSTAMGEFPQQIQPPQMNVGPGGVDGVTDPSGAGGGGGAGGGTGGPGTGGPFNPGEYPDPDGETDDPPGDWETDPPDDDWDPDDPNDPNDPDNDGETDDPHEPPDGDWETPDPPDDDWDPDDPDRPPNDPDRPDRPDLPEHERPDIPIGDTDYDPNAPDSEDGTDLSRSGGGTGGGGYGGGAGGSAGAGNPAGGTLGTGTGAGTTGTGGAGVGAGAGMTGAGAAGAGAGGGAGAGMRGGAGSGGMGMGMAPMMGGGAGQQGQGDEAERNTWLDEDDDVWGADDDGAPPVIGGAV